MTSAGFRYVPLDGGELRPAESIKVLTTWEKTSETWRKGRDSNPR
jgi:hypothetical protein